MEMADILKFQGVAWITFTMFLVFVLYGYIYHLYKSERTGRRDYEKYGNIALKDNLDDEPIEPISEKNTNTNYKEEH